LTKTAVRVRVAEMGVVVVWYISKQNLLDTAHLAQQQQQQQQEACTALQGETFARFRYEKSMKRPFTLLAGCYYSIQNGTHAHKQQ
jgi:hypothetical protein